VCGYAAEGVDPYVQHLDADRVRSLSDSGDILRYNLQTTGGTSGAPVFYLQGAEDTARQMSIGNLRVVAVHVDKDTPTLNQACRLTRAKIAWLQAGGAVSVGQALQLAGARALALDSQRRVPPAPKRVAARGLDASLVQRRTDTNDRDGVHFELEQLDGMRAPRTQVLTHTSVQSATLAIDDWPRMPDEHGGTFGAVSVAWSFADGAVGDVRVIPVHAGASDGWSLRVIGRVLDGPDAETIAAFTVELRHVFAKVGEPEHCSLIRVVVHGDGQHDRSNAWDQDPMHAAA
jgi:hypothetical protein